MTGGADPLRAPELPDAADPATSHYVLSHLDPAARRELAQALRCVEALDGFGLYLLATRANRALVGNGYADRVELRSGRVLTVILPGTVTRIELPEQEAEQQRRRLTDRLRGE